MLTSNGHLPQLQHPDDAAPSHLLRQYDRSVLSSSHLTPLADPLDRPSSSKLVSPQIPVPSQSGSTQPDSPEVVNTRVTRLVTAGVKRHYKPSKSRFVCTSGTDVPPRHRSIPTRGTASYLSIPVGCHAQRNDLRGRRLGQRVRVVWGAQPSAQPGQPRAQMHARAESGGAADPGVSGDGLLRDPRRGQNMQRGRGQEGLPQAVAADAPGQERPRTCRRGLQDGQPRLWRPRRQGEARQVRPLRHRPGLALRQRPAAKPLCWLCEQAAGRWTTHGRHGRRGPGHVGQRHQSGGDVCAFFWRRRRWVIVLADGLYASC